MSSRQAMFLIIIVIIIIIIIITVVEFKLATFLQLIGTIKKTIFKKVRTETVLK